MIYSLYPLHSFYIKQRQDIAYYKEMKGWLDDNNIKDYHWSSATDTITFGNSEDALAFKLKYWAYDGVH